MCRALKVLCAAPDQEGLAALKRAAVSTSWELVGGATSVQELLAQIEEWSPDVIVLHEGLGQGAVSAIRAGAPRARIVGVGQLDRVDDHALQADQVRTAVLGLPRPGGPVRGAS